MVVRIIVGVFIVLHGLVHLLYFGQSRRFFELQPGMVWPAGSWAFSKLLGEGTTGWLAGIACILAALGFVAGGTAILAGSRGGARWSWVQPRSLQPSLFSSGMGASRNWPIRVRSPS